jgi:competence/damage-inducible protein CinA-like protein
LNAEIISIGTELLLGEIVDTNATHIARALRDLGLDVWWISAVGDNEARIAEVVARALQRSAIVITTGGLGPTVDDPTREAIARACGRPLEYRPELWTQIEARFARFRRKPTENNRRQAYIPQGAMALENPVGTAPCFVVETEPGGVVISLPGVPREMEHMLANAVLPYLRQKFRLTDLIKAKILRTVGIGESLVDERIGELETGSNPTVGLAAHAGQTDVRITAKASSEAEADAMIAEMERKVRERLGDFIYGEGQETVEAVVGRMLTERSLTVAVAEAGTGGNLAGRLAVISNAAAVFRGGVIAAPDHLEFSVAGAAERARTERGADYGLAVAFTRQPEAAQIDVALADGEKTETTTSGYGGTPALGYIWAGTAALNLLRLRLLRTS